MVTTLGKQECKILHVIIYIIIDKNYPFMLHVSAYTLNHYEQPNSIEYIKWKNEISMYGVI